MLLRAPISITRRSASTAALSRLELDINAAHNKDQLIREPAEAVTKSAQAISGESLRGDVQLPKELQDAVEMAIAGSLSLPLVLCPLEMMTDTSLRP